MVGGDNDECLLPPAAADQVALELADQAVGISGLEKKALLRKNRQVYIRSPALVGSDPRVARQRSLWHLIAVRQESIRRVG